MPAYSGKVKFETSGENDMVDITGHVAGVIAKSRISNGTACVFCVGSTGSVTTVEYEPGLLEDIPNAMQKIAPAGTDYEHHRRWHDGNGHSHVRASLMGPSLSVPIIQGEMTLGTWQQIVFIEWDVKARSREVIISIVGE